MLSAEVYGIVNSLAYYDAMHLLSTENGHNLFLDDLDDRVHPSAFAEVLERFPQFEADGLSEAVHDGIFDAWREYNVS